MLKLFAIKRKWRIFAIVLVVLCVMTLLAFDTGLKVVYYDFKSKKITSPIRIAFIADLHSCYYGEKQSDLINTVNEQDPDIVLFGGDIIDDVLPPQNAVTVLETLSKDYPCYYVSGNHEYWTGHIDRIKQTVLDCGVQVLEGANETLSINSQSINICGIDDPEAGESIMLHQLAKASDQCDKNLLTVLLAHRPEYIDSYLDYDFDLILSGHAHGGQWRIPLLINGLYAPNQGWIPKYAGGRHELGNSTFIVSRGLAKESVRVPRVFNPPELVVIDITAFEEQ
jgi:predicted MPP superfamily phosphohydrolase